MANLLMTRRIFLQAAGLCAASAAVGLLPGCSGGKVTLQGSYALGERTSYSGFGMTLTKVYQSAGSLLNRPSSGKVFVIAEFEVSNELETERTLTAGEGFTGYFDNQNRSRSVSAELASGMERLEGKMSPGRSLHGVVGFEAPEDWQEMEIEFKYGSNSQYVIFRAARSQAVEL